MNGLNVNPLSRKQKFVVRNNKFQQKVRVNNRKI